MSDVAILMPWRGHDPERLRLRSWVEKRWDALMPAAERCYGAGPLVGPFNRSAAINEAFAASTASTLIIADSDTTPANKASVVMAIATANAVHGWALPYSVYYNIPSDVTEWFLRQPPEIGTRDGEQLAEPTVWEHRLTDSVSGLVVVPREAFELVGGFDERFVSWGWEDRAFELALTILWGPLYRVSSFCVHLWHFAPESVRFGSPYAEANRQLYAEYVAATRSVDAMRELVKR